MAKKKVDSPYETIQILKTDTARLMEMAMDISVANGEEYRNPPPPAQMINLAVDALEGIQLDKETLH
jgi:hypothetical protein